jgi:hypothetical protein
LASARVLRETRPRKPMWYSFGCMERRQASMSRRLSRYVSWAKAMHRNWSMHVKLLTFRLPPYRATHRWNELCGRKPMAWANMVGCTGMGYSLQCFGL